MLNGPGILAFLFLAGLLCSVARSEDPWVVYEGLKGPGQGKHIVLVSGDEEYRSEEALPQLGRILALRHGFKCTVLFAIDPKDGTINPNQLDNIPGLEMLANADLMIMFLRLRALPDVQMKHIVDYVESGRPILAMRTSTHAFKESKSYSKYGWQSSEWNGGFGRHVLGETWISHHGNHGSQATRGVPVPEQKEHPILRGLDKAIIFGPTDVYGVRIPLSEGCQPLVLGQVLEGMSITDKPVEGKQNDPMMPIAWTRPYKTESGKVARTFTTTMGASQDLEAHGTCRLLVNAAYWCLQMEDQIPPESESYNVGAYYPTPFKFDGYQRGVRPSDDPYATNHASDDLDGVVKRIQMGLPKGWTASRYARVITVAREQPVLHLAELGRPPQLDTETDEDYAQRHGRRTEYNVRLEFVPRLSDEKLQQLREARAKVAEERTDLKGKEAGSLRMRKLARHQLPKYYDDQHSIYAYPRIAGGLLLTEEFEEVDRVLKLLDQTFKSYDAK